MTQLNGDCIPMLKTLVAPERVARAGERDYLTKSEREEYNLQLKGEIEARLPRITNSDVWYLEYYREPYMAHFTRAQYIERWADIFNNLTLINEKNKISIGMPNESRWIRLFTHMLAESQFRGGVPKDATSDSDRASLLHNLNNPKQNIPLDYWNRPYIFKFGSKKWIERSLNTETIRLKSAGYYDGMDLNEAQKDNELAVSLSISPLYLKGISGLTGYSEIDKGLQENGIDIIFQHNRNFLIWCASRKFDPRIHYGFNYDSVLIIKDKKRFERD